VCADADRRTLPGRQLNVWRRAVPQCRPGESQDPYRMIYRINAVPIPNGQIFAKLLPGVMGPGVRQDDIVGVVRASVLPGYGTEVATGVMALLGKAAIVRDSCQLDVPKSVVPISRQPACRRQAVPCAREERLFQNHIAISTSTESSMPLFISYVSYSQTGI